MKVYLVYGLDKDDLSEESFVKKVFASEIESEKYCKEKYCKSNGESRSWFIVEMEVE
mgnify:CR=1 FL=1